MSKPPPKTPVPPSIAGMRYVPILTVTPELGRGKSRIVKYPTTLNALRSLVDLTESRVDANPVVKFRGATSLIPRTGEKPSPSERSKPSADAMRLLHQGNSATFKPTPGRANVSLAPSLPRLHATSIANTAALGEIVRIRRQMLRLSQKDLADQANVGRRFISELEAGKPTIELGKALAVCQVLRVSLTAETTDGR